MTKIVPDAQLVLGRREAHRHPHHDQVVAQVQEEETQRLHVHLPASLHKALKLHAIQQDRDMKAVVIEALTAHLRKDAESGEHDEMAVPIR